MAGTSQEAFLAVLSVEPSYLPAATIAANSWGGTTSSCAYVHSLGFLSPRHLRKRAICRNRDPCMCSYATSTTNSGRTGSHERSLPWLQRLCPPGTRCPSSPSPCAAAHAPQG